MTGQPNRPPLQPLDEWDFLPDDDLPDDGDAEPLLRRAAEDAALHIEARRELSPAEDPARSDVLVGTDGDSDERAATTYFEDEEPEGPARAPVQEDEHEPDLEELLESQHYAFGPEGERA